MKQAAASKQAYPRITLSGLLALTLIVALESLAIRLLGWSSILFAYLFAPALLGGVWLLLEWPSSRLAISAYRWALLLVLIAPPLTALSSTIGAIDQPRDLTTFFCLLFVQLVVAPVIWAPQYAVIRSEFD